MQQADIIKLKRLLEEYRVFVGNEAIAYDTYNDSQIQEIITAMNFTLEYIENDLKNPENQP